MNTRLPRTSNPRPALTRLAAAAGLVLLVACSSMPVRNAALDQARSRLNAAQDRHETVAMAADELARAREAMRRADQAQINGDSVAQVNHLSYLALQQVVIAEETAASRTDQAVVTGAAAERDRMRLAMRTREADTAQDERDRVARRDLESQLRDLNARQTDRGTVVALGDLLFDTGASRLRSEGQHSMDQLAGFMKRNPERHASIEGYTDSVGGTVSNQALSDRRAHSVMAALVQLGVSGSQLSTQAFGEDRPVAGNDTPAGRQMNRRVEVVLAREAADLVRK